MPRTLILIAALIAGVTSAAQAQNAWVVTGPAGGTAEANRDCSAGENSVTCSGSRTLTGVNGATRTIDGARVYTDGGVTGSGQASGFLGGTASWDRNAGGGAGSGSFTGPRGGTATWTRN